MTAAAKQLVKQALALPERERMELVRLLRKSLPDETEMLSQKEWDEAWEVELTKRMAEIESGKVKCIPYAEARKKWNKVLESLKYPELHPEASSEVSDALAYYQKHASSEIVNDFDARIDSALIEIGNHPERYSHWRRTNVRKYKLPRFPYLIFYVDHPDRVRILAVAHASRRPGYWRSRIAVD